MELKAKIQSDMKEAMKARDSLRLNAIRMLVAEIKKREIDKKSPLEHAEICKTISTLIKQRQDSIEAFKQGGRPDLVEKEEKEAALLKAYLPAQLSRSEVEAIVKQIITEVGAKSPADIGKIMKPAMAKLGPQADGKVVNELARSILSKPE